MHYYSQRLDRRALRCFLLWVNGLFPFLWPMRNLLRGMNYPRGLFLFIRDYFRLRFRDGHDPRFPLRFIDTYPCLFDRFDSSGAQPRHYFHQDIWAARKIFAAGTKTHYDLGSRIDGFVAHCAVFCRVIVYDIRDLKPLDPNIQFVQADIAHLPVDAGSLRSLSSLHVFEHLGLGRYGDPLGSTHLDAAVREVERVLAPGGDFYFSVPIGIQRLEFNAQRVFAPETVMQLFKNLELVEFSAIDDRDTLHLNAQPAAFHAAEYSCGLFHWRKKS